MMEAESVPKWQLLLPADWWQIPLPDPAAREAAADALAEYQFRDFDEVPTDALRVVREELRGMAEAAARQDGRMLAISTTVIEGIPLTCVLIVAMVDTETRTRIRPARLAREFATGRDSVPGAEVSIEQLPLAGTAIRRAYRIDQAPGAPAVPSTVVDYHVPAPGARCTVLRMTFSTPLPEELTEPVTALWDTIAASLTWQQAPAERQSMAGAGRG